MRLALLVTPMLAILAALWLIPQNSVAEPPPYEPNDFIGNAAGPLLAGESYVAAIETAGDRDDFYFYVTSPAATQAVFTVQNLGGGQQSDLDARILDASGTMLVGQAFIRDGEGRIVTAALEPQKYFVEIANGEGYGDSYSITPGGGEGAFGPYEQIAGRCASVDVMLGIGQSRLDRAQSKLQRATARLRRSRYALPPARQRAQAANRKAKARVKAAKQELGKARESRRPWCFIAP